MSRQPDNYEILPPRDGDTMPFRAEFMRRAEAYWQRWGRKHERAVPGGGTWAIYSEAEKWVTQRSLSNSGARYRLIDVQRKTVLAVFENGKEVEVQMSGWYNGVSTRVGQIALPSRVTNETLKILYALSNQQMTEPTVMPNGDGSLHIEWKTEDGAEVEMTVR